MTWPIVALADVATIDRRTVDPASLVAQTPYIGLEHIESGGRMIGRSSVGESAVSSTKFTFGPEHVLYGKLRPYLGKIAKPDFNGVCSTDILPIRAGQSLDRNYLTHYLRQPSMVALAAARATGANLPRLSPKELERFEVPLPPIEEQRRIAAILDHAESLRRRSVIRTQTTAHLDQMTFQKHFAGTGPRQPMKTLAGRITKGTTPSSLGLSTSLIGVPFLRAQNLQLGGVVHGSDDLFIDAVVHQALSRSVVLPGDVLLSIAGTIGRSAVVAQDSQEMNCNQAVAIIRLDDPSLASWMRCWLATPDAQSQMGASTVTGTISNLSLSQVGALQVHPPDSRVAMGFKRWHTISSERKGQLSEAVRTMERLLKSLQARAFAGEL